MILDNKYNFPEAKLDPDFAKDKLKEFKALIDANLSFVVISMPGVGVSCFLKFLAVQSFATFIHVDLYTLPSLSLHEFYKLLLTELGGKSFDSAQDVPPTGKSDERLLEEIKKNLKELSLKRGKVVIIFSRFDQLKNQFNSTFLSNIQSLTTVSSNPVVEIFTSIKPLYEIAPDALSGGNLNFYSEELYFKPYSKDDLKKLLKIEPARSTPKEVLGKLLDLSGGHNQLLHILLSSQKEQLLLDRFVKMQMKELVDYLDYHQRKTIQKIALGKKVASEASHPGLDPGSIMDDYLLGVGLVRQSTSEKIHLEGEKNAVTPSRWKTKEFELFTPLLSEYIKTNLPVKLPVKEAALFKLLRKNMGRTVPKDEIFKEVWSPPAGGSEEEASDWALDALIYRLRKHPFMQSHGYIIESHKKVGYTLIQT